MSLIKNKDKKKQLDRNEVSKNVQWLISLGGTIEMIEKIADCFCKIKQTVIMNYDKSKMLQLKSSMVFISTNNDEGHWVYYNNNGILYNSYNLDHQSSGSAQFCQSYAMLYMLGDNNSFMKKKFTSKLKSGVDNYGNNIRIVIKFWKYIFRYNTLLTNWIISEIKSINNFDIVNNYNSYITVNTEDINKKLIKKLLLYIYNNSEGIAQLC